MILEITAPHVARWTARQPSFTAERQQQEDMSESELAAIMPTLPRAQAVQHESRQGRRSGLRRRDARPNYSDTARRRKRESNGEGGGQGGKRLRR